MSGITISKTRDYFLKDGVKFFYLADTCWSAFTNPTFEEWEYYLEYRRMQGFNVLQINILPQHDRSPSENYVDPFKTFPDGRWDFSRRNEKYFDRAEKMVEMAVERGFTPALVVLWCNYVKGTWGSKISPSKIIPMDKLEEYVSYVAERYGKYNPIFIISGDTNFETGDSVEYYKTAFEIVDKICPNSLKTMHLAGGLWQVPETLVKLPSYDFYMYQSGHGKDAQHLSYELAQRFYNMLVKRPVVNGEPCYEGIGSIGSYSKYGRFNGFDVRKAVWQSLLSGAKAGVTYGAHGIWSWQGEGGNLKYPEKYASIYGAPYYWRTALRFPGAFDVSFSKWVFEKHDLFDIKPANEKLLNETAEIRVSEGEGKIIVYTPFNTDIKLKSDESYSKWEGIDLETRRVFKPKVEITENGFIIKMTEFNNDLLIIGSRMRR
ncbi:MAG: DUF4038 domain-containing protein [Candidatus Brockarchaeota archaeon]|nr:DUF4038 domain-containing protein [Candidatus Brockarchaeota archaeon]MBO3808069.1 DUF4038 domain-containing protein [Candidatus Brockarchaeota archaeon]